MNEGVPSSSPGWQKEKNCLFLGFDFETSELAFFKKVIFDFLVRLIIF
jgi:hypothetical protein